MKLITAITIFLFATSLHFVANAMGLYDLQVEAGFVWIDNVLHLLDGVAVGLLCLYLIEKYRPNTSFASAALIVLVSVTFVAVVWESAELIFLILFTTYAKSLQIYSPTFVEGASDVLSNIAGALALIVWLWFMRAVQPSPRENNNPALRT